MRKLLLMATVIDSLLLAGCADCQSSFSHAKSSMTGLNRRVTVYSMTGEVIKTYEGRMKVEDMPNGTYRFVLDGKAIKVPAAMTVIEEI